MGSTSPPKRQRRASVRVRSGAPFELGIVAVDHDSDHNFYVGYIEDISSGGLFIATPDVKPVGTRMKIRFSVPGMNDAAPAEVTVRWIRDVPDVQRSGMGVQFEELAPELRDLINRFIAAREPLFFDHGD